MDEPKKSGLIQSTKDIIAVIGIEEMYEGNEAEQGGKGVASALVGGLEL
ncbi:hypothetical protein [Candidatus Methanocrinis natronophilus]|uniref:Uncharacterized protein n=1 Tax=Candidatus Methanocrinis natronophilus TaxID=3033396 RepID=A0ABT5X4Z6_9EURY|nr:hypothetical protein [Candidatus Methanocrinis natronophilus]MDF0589773.1 hypothetical protein [Candidatus Methanocrinis natronophilus]